MDIRRPTMWTIVCVIVLTLSTSLSATNFTRVKEKTSLDNLKPHNISETAFEGSSALYNGKIKVQIIEPDSRWQDNTGVNYDNAHLKYIVVNNLNIPDASVWDTSITWNGALDGYGDITVDNIAAVAAVFNGNGVSVQADPGNGNWFTAYYADASAMAFPGIIGMNESNETFTHTVYVEEGTATW